MSEHTILKKNNQFAFVITFVKSERNFLNNDKMSTRWTSNALKKVVAGEFATLERQGPWC